MPRRDLLRGGLGVALAVAVSSAGTVAWAQMTAASPSTSHTLSTGTLEAPTSPATAAGTCLTLVGDEIVVTWTATSSLKADGYEILRAVGTGTYVSHALVPGQATVSFTDTLLSFSTTYNYVVKAKKENWRSAGTSPVSRNTRTALCV